MASTWNGWQAALLNGAHIIVTPPNMNFLTDWHRQQGGTCNNNPVDLSTQVGGSTRCGNTVAGFGRTQNYPSHTAAAHAFQIQIDSPGMRALKAALDSGNPFQIADRGPVVAALKQWGSPTFAAWYATASSGGGGGGGGGGTTGVHKGWADLQRSVSHRRLGNKISATNRMDAATLRAIQRAHKVLHK